MFIFFHIPKAAGTTIRELIAEQLQPEIMAHIEDVSRIAYQSDAWLNSHDFISGHFGAAILPRLRGDAKKYTMLRDPVSRVKSQFRYMQALASMDVAFNGYQALLRGRDLLSILADKSDPLINSLFRDTQTWTLTTDYQHHYRNFEVNRDEVFAIAKSNLAAMDCFGIMENMADSLRLLNTTFGFHIDVAEGKLVKENESSKSKEGNDEPILDEVIRENNLLDVELYQWATEKFNSSLLPSSAIKTSPRETPIEKPVIDLDLYSLEKTDIASHLSYAMLHERVQAAEKMNSRLSQLTIELRRWMEQNQGLLKKEREQAREVQRWAERSDAALVTERETSKHLREWAERSDAALVAEREQSYQLREILNNRRRLFSRFFSLKPIL